MGTQGCNFMKKIVACAREHAIWMYVGAAVAVLILLLN